jgi:uncharacterized protein (TIGR02996 family)
VLERPEDDEARLVYADALVEAGDPRGEYIQAAIQLARAPRRALREVARDADRFAKDLPAGVKPTWRRGFIEELAGEWRAVATALMTLIDREPVRSIRATVRGDEAIAIFRHPGARQLDEIVVVCPAYPRELVAALPELAAPPRLRSLGIVVEGPRPVTDELVAEALASSPLLDRIERLLLSDRAGAADVEALLASARVGALRELDLGESSLGPFGLAAIAGAPRAAQLQRLRLGTAIDQRGAETLNDSPHLRSGLELHARLTFGSKAARRLLRRFRVVEE